MEHFGLKVDREKKKGRQYGWAKIYRNGAHGALNLQWLAGPRTLVGRIVTKGEGCPALLAGTFLCYVLARYRNEVKAVHVWIQEGDEEDADEV
ncbi:MAG: hypothetical protein NZR01_00205 [Bryobacteraceae bacterium]|nr:hypothetical protein [Bryobacteraceae bacterium]